MSYRIPNLEQRRADTATPLLKCTNLLLRPYPVDPPVNPLSRMVVATVENAGDASSYHAVLDLYSIIDKNYASEGTKFDVLTKDLFFRKVLTIMPGEHCDIDLRRHTILHGIVHGPHGENIHIEHYYLIVVFYDPIYDGKEFDTINLSSRQQRQYII